MSYEEMLAALRYYDPSISWSLPQVASGQYEALVWHNTELAKPTEDDLSAAWADVEPAFVAAAWDAVRRERDVLLAASDWTQVADAPVDAAAWAVYRQKLRDIPQDFASPDDVIWPTAP